MNEVLEKFLFAIKTEGDPKIKSNLMVQIIPFVLGCFLIVLYSIPYNIYKYGGEMPDSLREELAGENFLSSWRLSHFLLHLIAGLLCPRSWWLWLLMGICWELTERTLALIFRDNWWGTNLAHLEDIVANTAGFIVGFSLRKLLTRANSLGTVTG